MTDRTGPGGPRLRTVPLELVCEGCRRPFEITHCGRLPRLCPACKDDIEIRRKIGQLVPEGRCATCGESAPRKYRTYQRYCSDRCTPKCAAPNCDEKMKYRTPLGRLCPAHYVRWKTYGDTSTVLLIHDRRAPGPECKQCGGPRGDGYAKWFCSVRCTGRYRRGIDESYEWPCVDCGRSISIQGSRADAKRCALCRSVHPCLTANELAERDGATCGICGGPVDTSLSGRELMGPVVDHVIPRAHRGPNTPGNVQLAHMLCNARKQDRLTG